MLLVDLPEDRLDEFSDMLSEVGFDYNVTYDIWFMPVVKKILIIFIIGVKHIHFTPMW